MSESLDAATRRAESLLKDNIEREESIAKAQLKAKNFESTRRTFFNLWLSYEKLHHITGHDQDKNRADAAWKSMETLDALNALLLWASQE